MNEFLELNDNSPESEVSCLQKKEVTFRLKRFIRSRWKMIILCVLFGVVLLAINFVARNYLYDPTGAVGVFYTNNSSQKLYVEVIYGRDAWIPLYGQNKENVIAKNSKDVYVSAKCYINMLLPPFEQMTPTFVIRLDGKSAIEINGWRCLEHVSNIVVTEKGACLVDFDGFVVDHLEWGYSYGRGNMKVPASKKVALKDKVFFKKNP